MRNCSTTKTKPQHACNKPYSEVVSRSQTLSNLERVGNARLTLKLKTWLTSLPPANVTLGVQQPAVSERKKASKSVALGTDTSLYYSILLKTLQQVTTITTENGDPSLITARNDCLLNSYNPVQLSGWRAIMDMQYVVSRRRVINYVAKYATNSNNTPMLYFYTDENMPPSQKTVTVSMYNSFF